ncbi:FHA domain-containing protein [Nocardia sp. 004]|uniref:FHA domain-containing protein n=1 Tax=Nocardia sp. 004 TaxID=3385978 RepID=UPI0039A05FCF
MRRKPFTVGVVAGEGLIARFGAVVAYLGAETASTDRILGTIEAVAEEEYPGAALATRLATVIFGGTAQPPPFGIVAPTADGTVILLRGPVLAEIQGAEGTRRLVGGRAFTWVDEIVREPVRRITIGADTGAPMRALPRTDLRAGVVPGGGFVQNIAPRRTEKTSTGRPASPRPVERSAQAEPEPTAATGFAAQPEPTGASDAVAPAAPTAQPTGAARLLATPRQTRPATDHVLAWSRRQPTTHQPIALQEAPEHGKTRTAPPASATAETVAGALVTADGTTYPLDRPYVLGRGPQIDESVRTATAAPLVIQRDRHVSRVHAYVSIAEGKVYVRDAATTSGTFIAAPGSDQWIRITTAPTELPPGWRVRISERILTHRGEDQHRNTTDSASPRHT